jgi:hypothetical protein
MKTKIIIFIFIFIFSNSINSSLPIVLQLKENGYVELMLNNLMEKENQFLNYKKWLNEIKEFLDVIAYQESSNNWKIYNKYGYIGKYQFGYSARKQVGYDIKYSDWVKNPYIWNEDEQDIAMIRYLRYNNKQLKNIIKDNEKYKIKNKKITKSGILAAAHLAGSGNVEKFFKTNGDYDPKDKFGTHLSDYLVKFSGYRLNL